jgi:tetratricopeptide (TPR) repeat protein
VRSIRVKPAIVLMVCALGCSGLALAKSPSSAAVAEGETVRVVDQLAEIDRLIADLEVTIAATPTSSHLDLLGSLLLRRLRIAGDGSSLDRAARTATEAVSKAPNNPSAQVLRGQVLVAEHRFAEAEAAVRNLANAGTPEALAISVDSLAEVGNLAEARDRLNLLMKTTPDAPAVTVRRARLAQLQGDLATAVRLAEAARRDSAAIGAVGADRAFFESFAGQMLFDVGRHEEAIERFRAATATAPGDRAATVGLARSLGATGRFDDAIELLEPLVEVFPDPVALALLGDLQIVSGRGAAGTLTHELVLATLDLSAANGRAFDRQLAMFLADHRLRPEVAVRMAEDELRDRKDAYGYDTFAWALFRAGDADAAWVAVQKALSSGIADAAIYGHAGLIAAALGDTERAADLLQRSIDLNPAFHPLVAQEVRNAFAQLS